jgi:hypothetical protein
MVLKVLTKEKRVLNAAPQVAKGVAAGEVLHGRCSCDSVPYLIEE